jgi:hypothetical protein
LVNSILRHASGPVSITPLVQSQLREKGLYWRERNNFESTEFSMTRFLVPYLCDYGDYAVFLDCDQLVQGDIYEIVDIAKADDHRCVWCVQHEYIPKTKFKMDHQVQTSYPRKNWSSVMVFKNKFCTALTPKYVNEASGLELHRMAWAGENPENIGHLPMEWNWLVGEYEKNDTAKLYHYTLGSPFFPAYGDCDHSELWWAEYERMLFPLVVREKDEVTT